METRKSKKVMVAASQNVREREYWLKQLSGLEKVHFPYDHKESPVEKRKIDGFPFKITGRLFSRLQTMCSGSDAKLHVILTAAVTALLARYTGKEDITLGIPIYRQETKGDFINTVLVIRSQVKLEMTLKELIIRVHQAIFAANENQNYPLEVLPEQLKLLDSGAGNECPLFDIIVLLENIHDPKFIDRVNSNTVFSFIRKREYIEGILEYNLALYDPASVERIVSHWEIMLHEALFNVDRRLSDIDIISPEEKSWLLFKFNAAEAGYPGDKAIHEIFKGQVARSASKTAVIHSDSQVSGIPSLKYKELNEKADRLAMRLQAKGVKPDGITGIMAERSIEMVIGILAILKAGGAYMPLDPDYPDERIDFMLADSDADILLTTRDLAKRTSFDREIINFEDKEIDMTGKTSPENGSKPGSLAYIIYTSGTTGKPKGVMIEHRQVVRLMFHDNYRFDFSSRDVWTLFHSFCFDFSVWEMYGALLYGGKLVIIPRMTAVDPEKFRQVLIEEGVTVLNQTPSAFYNLINEELTYMHKGLHLRYVIFGGEALKPAKLKSWKDRYPETLLINMFGITETTVHVTYKEVTQKEIDRDTCNIGKAIPTLSAYVMDNHLNLLPLGVPGELCVGGAGVARGYLNRPSLTIEKFIKNPYIPGERLYKSGDLVKLFDNGDMEYSGRIDHQVQFHGFRIELQEIERRLLENDTIKDAVVVTGSKDNEITYLCGYIVADRKFSPSELRNYLSTALPHYMIPGYFVQLDNIPLTSNGKVDRKALPPVEIAGDEYISPRDPLEEKLVRIWQQVLDLEKVGIKDNFFNIGGDSIKTIKLVSTINTQLSADLKIVDIYANETIEKLALRFKQCKPSERDEELEVLKELEELKIRVLAQDILPSAENIEDIYPMSDIESGMLFYSLRDREFTLYHDQMVYQVKYQEFDPKIFKQAVVLMAEKHSILRTCFNIEDFGQSLQVVYKNVVLNNIEHCDISNMNIPGQETYLNQFLEEDRRNPYKLTEPLWRMRTFECGSGNIVVMFTVHHAIMDGWSNAAFLTELNNTYIMLKSEPGFVPQKLKNTYKAFIIEQIIEKRNREVYDYWRNELEGYKRLELPGWGAGRYEDVDERKKYMHELGPELAERIKNSAKKYNSSLDHLCFGAYVYLLGMLSYDNDIVTGLVVNNRPRCEDGDKIVGCFLNTVPVRIRIPVNITWLDYIAFIDGKLLELKKYERLSLFEIVQILGVKSEARNPLFDMLFNYIDFYVFQQLDADNDHHVVNADDGVLSVTGHAITNTLIDFNVDKTFGRFRLGISYSYRLVGDRVIRQLCSYFERVLDKFLDEPDGFANRNEIISNEEKEMILVNFNDTKTDYPREKTITDLFEEQVKKTPDAKAAVYEDEALTYKELNKRAHCLARVIRKKGVKPDEVVGIMSGLSIEIIIGILGILKGGGAYLSIDPGCPDERKRYMLEDSQVRLVLSRGFFSGAIKNIGNKYDVINLQSEHLYRGSIEELEIITGSGNLAYVIYTSGSTGEPKGVMVENKSVVRLVKKTNYIKFGEDSRVLQTGALEFDASTFEIWGALLNGSILYLADKEKISVPACLKEVIRDYRINLMWMTAGLFNQMLDADIEIFRGLRDMVIGGDVLSLVRVNKLRHKYPNLNVINGYGPTENTTFSACFLVDKDYDISIPIGKPISNSRAYILNKYNELQPIGAVGQLYLAGDGLARGYLNNAGFTAGKFMDHPFIRGERIYMTGDLARWLPGGIIEFAGRLDHQVKIRGYRVEPGEIENQLLKIDYIKEVVVTSLENQGEPGVWERGEGSDKSLCAYIVPAGNDNIDISMLKNALSTKLPGYMVPSSFVQLEKIPLTTNGKIDRKALPIPEFRAGHDYVSPGNEIQKRLIAIWSEVLNVDKNIIGIDSDFFDLGGHSLKATNLIARIHKELDVKINLVEIFEKPTVRELSQLISESEENRYFSIKPVEKKEYYSLSAAQKRLFILQVMNPAAVTSNLPMVIPLKESVDKEMLEKGFSKLVGRHECFRTSLRMINNQPVQIIHENLGFEIEYFGLPKLSREGESENKGALFEIVQEIINGFMRAFDLSKAPLMRGGLIQLEEEQYVLMVDMHHIISDGISINITIRDFMRLYAGKELPGLRLQYKDYAEWLNKEMQKQAVKKQEEYWLRELSGELPVLNLPTDYTRPEVQSWEASKVHFKIEKEELEALSLMAVEENATLYIILFAIFNVFLSRLTGQEDIIIGTVTSGRNHEDLKGIVGMFVNTVPLRNYPVGEKIVREFISEVKERTLNAFENQEYQLDDLVDQILDKRDISRNPIFDVMFVFQNQFERSVYIPEEESSSELTSFSYDRQEFISDLILVIMEGSEHLSVYLTYCTKLFEKGTIDLMVEKFLIMVKDIVNNGNCRIKELEFRTPLEKRLSQVKEISFNI